jgi:hypothetical protein
MQCGETYKICAFRVMHFMISAQAGKDNVFKNKALICFEYDRNILLMSTPTRFNRGIASDFFKSVI